MSQTFTVSGSSEVLKYVRPCVFDEPNFCPGTMVPGSFHFEPDVLQKKRRIEKARESEPKNDQENQNRNRLKKIEIERKHKRKLVRSK